ncbi:MAG: hypothetical protein GY862_26990 [Gammaproteobacteria bacterium]|nr:hypothetical protein [Gammaproteobacteria bacterium]
MNGIRHDSLKARLEARRKLINKLDSVAAKTGMSRAAVSVTIGLNTNRLNKIINSDGDGFTLDTLVLYLRRLGTKTRFYFVDEDEEDNNDTGTFCA